MKQSIHIHGAFYNIILLDHDISQNVTFTMDNRVEVLFYLCFYTHSVVLFFLSVLHVQWHPDLPRVQGTPTYSRPATPLS